MLEKQANLQLHGVHAVKAAWRQRGGLGGCAYVQAPQKLQGSREVQPGSGEQEHERARTFAVSPHQNLVLVLADGTDEPRVVVRQRQRRVDDDLHSPERV